MGDHFFSLSNQGEQLTDNKETEIGYGVIAALMCAVHSVKILGIPS